VKVLVVGGGGREHALAWRLARDPTVTRVFATPGNAGIAQVAECIDVRVDDVDAVTDLVERLDADLTVIGPEAPLVAGLADAVRKEGRAVFGPSAAAARIAARVVADGCSSSAALASRYRLAGASSRSVLIAMPPSPSAASPSHSAAGS